MEDLCAFCSIGRCCQCFVYVFNVLRRKERFQLKISLSDCLTVQVNITSWTIILPVRRSYIQFRATFVAKHYRDHVSLLL